MDTVFYFMEYTFGLSFIEMVIQLFYTSLNVFTSSNFLSSTLIISGNVILCNQQLSLDLLYIVFMLTNVQLLSSKWIQFGKEER